MGEAGEGVDWRSVKSSAMMIARVGDAMIKRFCVAVLLVALAACGPNLGDLEAGERGEVTEVLDGDTIVLEGGLRVTLTGIEAPFGREEFAREARAGLEELTLARPVRLGYAGLRRLPPRTPRLAEPSNAPQPVAAIAGAETPAPSAAAETTPRPETALAQVFVQSEGGRWIWVQAAMVSRGLAFVRPRAETAARVPELLAAERQAREARMGLWRESAYRVRTAAAIERETYEGERCGRGPFRLVEGVVRSIGDQSDRGRVYFNFGERYNEDFTAAIYGDDVEAWGGPAFSSYEGRRVRVRGRVIERGGPLICVDNAAMIEMLAG